MATIVQTQTRKRGFFGRLAKWAFILFNLFMAFWLFSYWGELSETSQAITTEAGRAGATIGGTIGTGIIVFFWLAGAVILGMTALLTRGKLVITETRQD